MSASDLVTESRDVSDFDRVTLRDYGDLVITQGDEESLTVEAAPEVLKKIKTEVRDGRLDIQIGATWPEKLVQAITTGLSMKSIKYVLTVKELTGLEILGAGRVRLSSIETERLRVILGGAGDIRAESLKADKLGVDLSGAGRVEMAGKVAEQKVVIAGAGNYKAPKLESKKADVDLTGAGKATVWAAETLDVAIQGMGTVDYYGSPTVQKSISGLGTVSSLGEP